MPASKIQNETEVLRWFEEGRTYAWMTEQYLEKYGIEMSPSAWGNFRRRRGLTRRITRDDDLIPWEVNREHRWAWPINMLRQEARRRAGNQLTDKMAANVDAWLAGMERDGTVLHYDGETAEGWFYVPRRTGIDKDIIRVPERKTSHRLAAD